MLFSLHPTIIALVLAITISFYFNTLAQKEYESGGGREIVQYEWNNFLLLL